MAVVLPALKRRVSREMLGAGDDVLAVREFLERTPLAAAHPCRADAPGKIRILAVRAADAAPARIIGDVNLRRVCKLDADGGGFARGHGLGLLDRRIVPATRYGDLAWKRRHPAVRDVLVHDQRNAEAGMRHLVFLEPTRLLRAQHAHQRTDLIPADHVGIDVPVVLAEVHVVVDHQLAGLLLQRHARTKFARTRLGAVEGVFGMNDRGRQECANGNYPQNPNRLVFHLASVPISVSGLSAPCRECP